jgi:hypothetical protein
LLISDVSVFEFFVESFTVMSLTVVDGIFTDGYVISATKRDTLRRHAKERRYQIHGNYTY